MSFHLGTNTWAPKLIIVFQLATWSIIGFILIEKGTIYLRVKEQKYQQNTTKRNIPAVGDREGDLGTSTTFGGILNKTSGIWPIEIGDMREHQQQRKTVSRENRRRRFDVVGDRVVDRNEKLLALRNDSRQENIGYTPSAHPKNFTVKYARKFEEKIQTTDSDKIVLVTERNKGNNESGASADESQKDASSRSKYLRNSQRHNTVNSAGAAAALVMLCIGVIMVLLGPAIVILRAFDARRQQRTLSLTTSSVDKDLPPSYEQATLMDQAPRYSTLRLNAIPEIFPLQSSSTSTTFH